MELEIINNRVVTKHDANIINVKKRNKSYLLLYKIFCSPPKYLDDQIEGVIEIPKRVLGQGEFFALIANGDSMVDAGIKEGDIVIVRAQNTAENGNIVAVRIGEEVTLKRYYELRKEKKYLLHPENKKQTDIITAECDIMGIAIKIIKDLV